MSLEAVKQPSSFSWVYYTLRNTKDKASPSDIQQLNISNWIFTIEGKKKQLDEAIGGSLSMDPLVRKKDV